MSSKELLYILAIVSISKSNATPAESSLDFLNNGNENTPLVCGYADNQWYQKSGPDFVGLTKVESQTLYVQADDINGQIKGNHIAQGNVVGYKDNQTMFTDWLIYNQEENHVTMGDNIYLTRQYDAIQGKWGDYFLDLDKGTFTEARAYYGKDNLTFTGQEINVQDKQHATIDSGYVTACNPNNPAWYIQADKLNVDYADSTGEATNAVMYFESVPIFASPYLTFPLGQRRSGWLTPNIGGTSTSGAMVSDSYYWNMAPNYDMTITPEVWANQGFMLTDEFRYMTQNNKGSIYTEQLPYSWAAMPPDTPNYRWYWNGTDTYTPFKDFSMGYNFNQVSDPNYFNDFGNFYSVTDNVNLLQNAFMTYKPTWGLASIQVQTFQTLYPYGTQSTIPIYSQYPAVNFNVNPQDMGAGFKWNLLSSYAYYDSPNLQSGQRLVAYPSITYPMQSSWGSVTPKVGFDTVQYNLGVNPASSEAQPLASAGSQQLNVPITSLDSSLYFDRPFTLGNSSMTQTLEPRVYYLYIPAINQANLPVFDTATATYNYNQLFSENQFTGSDRVNAANDITFGGTSRIINDANGNEVMKLNLGYRYFITQESNSLYGTFSQYPQLYLPTPNAIAELTNQWSKQISSNASFQYDTTQGNIDYYNINMKWNPDTGKIINLGYSYQYQMPLLYYNYTPGQSFQPVYYENQYALNLSGQWPIYMNKVYALGRANYDFTRNMLLNLVGGLELNAGCYSVSAVYEQYIFNYNQMQQNYMLNFNFKGIGNVGSGDPSKDLATNISGYQPIYSILQNQTQY